MAIEVGKEAGIGDGGGVGYWGGIEGLVSLDWGPRSAYRVLAVSGRYLRFRFRPHLGRQAVSAGS